VFWRGGVVFPAPVLHSDAHLKRTLRFFFEPIVPGWGARAKCPGWPTPPAVELHHHGHADESEVIDGN
ncbi:MAG: hypothetical protein OEW88_09390, partial [Gammaproteobacteria bacterium]|nr:hypothetical protein [Gammaproteobacteria bacterium]